MHYRHQGEGFIIRPFKETDLSAFIKYLSHPEVYHNTYRFPKDVTESFAKSYIAHAIAGVASDKPTSLHLAIEVDGDVVGDISFLKIEGHKAEIAYWLSPLHWGKGIMPQAVQWFCEMASRELSIIRIYAAVFDYNQNSARVLSKVGFEKEGCMRKSYLKDGRLLDANLFALIR